MPVFTERFLSIFMSVAMLVATSGCATIGGWSQHVKVATDADSARVSLDGYELGTAPGFVKLRRASSRTLVVTSEGKSKDLVVEGRYRWRDSFAANFFAAIFSPYLAVGGLGLDFLTGAAWRYDKPDKIYFHKGEPAKPLLPKSIAVAPPRYGNELASDEIASELYLLLRQRFPHVRIVSQDQLVATYMSYETDNENFVPLEHRDDLYREMGTSHMAFSRVSEEGNGLVITVRVVDILRDEVVDKFTLAVAKRELRTTDSGLWSFTRGQLVKLIPNSIGVQAAWGGFWRKDWGSYNGVGEQYEIKRTNSLGMFNSNLTLTSSNVINLKTRPSFAFRARLVPLGTLRNDEFEGSDTPDFYTTARTKWSLLQLGFGIGPELGVETALGYFYLNYVPQVTNYWIRGPMEYGLWKIVQNAEVGYSFFIADRINARLSFHAHLYPHEVLEPIIRDKAPNANISEYSLYFLDTTTTFAIEYVFPEARKKMTRIIE